MTAARRTGRRNPNIHARSCRLVAASCAGTSGDCGLGAGNSGAVASSFRAGVGCAAAGAATACLFDTRGAYAKCKAGQATGLVRDVKKSRAGPILLCKFPVFNTVRLLGLDAQPCFSVRLIA